MKRKISSLVLLLVLGTARLWATDIVFSSPLLESGQTSTGFDLTSGFTFSLGSFGSFIPTAGNTSLWLTNFTSLGSTHWDADAGGFGGTVPLNSNTAPFQTTQQGYIWGYNLTSGAAEWVLLTNPTWKFPLSSTVLATQWGTADAGTFAIVGFLGIAQTSANPYLQTAAVVTAVPEPATTAALLGILSLGLVLLRRRSLASR